MPSNPRPSTLLPPWWWPATLPKLRQRLQPQLNRPSRLQLLHLPSSASSTPCPRAFAIWEDLLLQFRRKGQGWRPAERLNRAVNELAAAAPTPDTCPLLLNDLDTEVASAFTFNSEPVEEQTTSINDVLNILRTNIQCIALAWEVQGNLRWI
ncbi:hypothetical protein IWX90DRAFT_265122 [Phyllosticta citrichinensis]|uniref:Uncharacterized protein n=1 Tax=Phyllosticta citrichinensis TaxID=1130410 RepID=A0ABR1XM55_9PEZI